MSIFFLTFGQEVVSKNGHAPVRKAVPNPVTLKPYRTFPEIEQPESIFIVRLQKTPYAGVRLFPADGNMWKVESIGNIKSFLSTNITKDIPIIG